MTNAPQMPMVCTNCHGDVALTISSVPIQISAAMRLRLHTFGTQVQCPHCRQPFIHRAHPTQAPMGLPVQSPRVIQG